MCYKLQSSLQTDQFLVTVGVEEKSTVAADIFKIEPVGCLSLKVRKGKPATAGESLSN